MRRVFGYAGRVHELRFLSIWRYVQVEVDGELVWDNDYVYVEITPTELTLVR